jgi:hypothetical protein
MSKEMVKDGSHSDLALFEAAAKKHTGRTFPLGLFPKCIPGALIDSARSCSTYIGNPSVKLPGKNQKSLWLRGCELKKGQTLGAEGYFGPLGTRKPRNSSATFKTGVDVVSKGVNVSVMLTADPRCCLGYINDPSFGPYGKAGAKPNVQFVGGNDASLMQSGACLILF